MKSRRLRIAFSTMCVIASVLLIAFWARSNHTLDFLEWNKTKYGWGVSITSFHSRCEFSFASYNKAWTNMKAGLTSKAVPNANWSWSTNPWFGFGINRTDMGNHFLMVPHWFLVLLTSFLAATPWIPWHFSLRTLIAVTTLLAAILGVAAITARK
jgi:hypothetical protein